jgi:hypothetical protein
VKPQAAIKRSGDRNFSIRKYNSHAARNLVARNVFAGFGVDGWMPFFCEGVRKNLKRNDYDLFHRFPSTSAFHLLVCRSGSSGMVLNQDIS